MSQINTSANTSTNSTKLPAIYNKINWDKLLANTTNKKPTILDYGAGKYTDHIRTFCKEKGFEYKAYDPYNGSDDGWNTIIPTLIICSNVLNVIDDYDTIYNIHEWIYHKNVPYVITVYEGNRSNLGKKSKKDCYQRNERIINYKRKDEIIYKNIITLEQYKQFVK